MSQGGKAEEKLWPMRAHMSDMYDVSDKYVTLKVFTTGVKGYKC